jgi:hypothetical protein
MGKALRIEFCQLAKVFCALMMYFILVNIFDFAAD